MTNGKRGQGRPPGGTSLVNVRFGDLKSCITDDMVIPVGRVFLEKLGIADQLILGATNKQKEPESTKPDIKVLNFDVPS